MPLSIFFLPEKSNELMKKERHASKEIKTKAQYSLLKAMENGWAHTMKRRARDKSKNPSLTISLEPDPKQKEEDKDMAQLSLAMCLPRPCLRCRSSAPGGEEPGASRAGVDPAS